jgi:hypothetical protein
MGMAAAASHAGQVLMSVLPKSIPASFKGHVQISGSKLTITSLTGTIGTDHFTGSGAGTAAGKQFQGGSVSLSNGLGKIQLKLGPSFVVKVGRFSKQEVSVNVVTSSGKYAAYAHMTGTLTSWNVPARPSASASFGGTFNG